MPQLMPLFWISSSLMIFLLLIVFVNLFFMLNKNLMMSYFNKSISKFNELKW